MSHRLFHILHVLALSAAAFISVPLCAQRVSEPAENAKKAGDGEINRQQDFFDPTRKQEKEETVYVFSCDWRVEAGYVQNQQRSANSTHLNPFTHGAKIGFTADLNLPLHFSLQTGAAFCATYGRIDQHWRSLSQETQQTEYIRHGINQYYLDIPLRVTYTQTLWRELRLIFYAGPKMQLGLFEMDWQTLHLSDPAQKWLSEQGVAVSSHDRYQGFSYTDKDGNTQRNPRELRRCNIQFGLGGAFEWDRYRLTSGYDFGLNNLLYDKPVKKSHMWQWGWFVSFAYRL